MLSNLDITKYPRINSDKEYTDNVIYIFLIHKIFLEKLVESVEKAKKYFNECKDYYFTFNFPYTNIKKTYSGKDICSLMNINSIHLPKLPKIDQLYYIYYRNRNFYMNLFKSIEYSKIHFLKVTNYIII